MSAASPVPDWFSSVSRETTERLETFWALVQKWNPRINLIASSTISEGWKRHVLDSVQLWSDSLEEGGTLLDIGSGGGFPGIVIAIMAKERSPGMKVVLVESDQRKCIFLREAIRLLGLSCTVLSERVERLPPVGADVLTARALASLTILLGYAERHLAADGIAIFSKGRSVQDELEEARQRWRFECEVRPSLTDPEGSVVKVWGIGNV